MNDGFLSFVFFSMTALRSCADVNCDVVLLTFCEVITESDSTESERRQCF